MPPRSTPHLILPAEHLLVQFPPADSLGRIHCMNCCRARFGTTGERFPAPNGAHHFVTGGGAPLYDVDKPPACTTQKVVSTGNFVPVKVDGRAVHIEGRKPGGTTQLDVTEVRAKQVARGSGCPEPNRRSRVSTRVPPGRDPGGRADSAILQNPRV